MTNNWIGDAQAVAQTSAVTIAGTPVAGQTFSVSVGLKVAVYTAVAGDTTSLVAAGLQVLLASSTTAEIREVAWTVSGSVVAGKSPVAGRPFSISATTAGGTGTIAAATSIASAGPNHWDSPANWSTGAAPISTDDIVVANSAVSILYNLPTGTPTFASLLLRNYSGSIGLPDINVSGYREYRNTTLFGRYSGSGNLATIGEGVSSALIRLDFAASVANVRVLSTGATSSAQAVSVPALLLSGCTTTSTLSVVRGSVGVAANPGQVATLASIRLGQDSSPTTDVAVAMGDGAVVASVVQSGGTVRSHATVATLLMAAGTWVQYDGAISNVTIHGGEMRYLSASTIAVLLADDTDAKFDCSRDIRTRTITSATVIGSGMSNTSISTFSPGSSRVEKSVSRRAN